MNIERNMRQAAASMRINIGFDQNDMKYGILDDSITMNISDRLINDAAAVWLFWREKKAHAHAHDKRW